MLLRKTQYPWLQAISPKNFKKQKNLDESKARRTIYLAMDMVYLNVNIQHWSHRANPGLICTAEKPPKLAYPWTGISCQIPSLGCSALYSKSNINKILSRVFLNLLQNLYFWLQRKRQGRSIGIKSSVAVGTSMQHQYNKHTQLHIFSE